MTEPSHSYDEAHQPGTPPGMTADDVEVRFEIGKWFGKDIWPADRSALLAKVEDMGAPDEVVDRVRQIPDRKYVNTQDVIAEMGIGVEQKRP